jgi:hypothetical protein
MKSAVPSLVLAAMLLSCGGPPVVTPAAPEAREDLLERCLGVFPSPDFRVVHSIAADLPGGATGVFLGVAATSGGGRTFRGNLLSLEGMVLVDVEWSPDGLIVHRALPPLDVEGFAAGMAADMRLLLLAPEGAPRDVGTDGEGRTECRWVGQDGTMQDVTFGENGEWASTTWDAAGRALRQVRASGRTSDGFASRMELTARGEQAYSLVLELVEVQAVGADAAEDREGAVGGPGGPAAAHSSPGRRSRRRSQSAVP